MTIPLSESKTQDSPHNFIRIAPDGDNPLDLCRIFSRNRYRNDFTGSIARADKRRVNMTASHIYHEAKFNERRVSRDRVRLHIHRDMIRARVEAPFLDRNAGGGKRGKVAGFSRASRKRMIDLMCSHRHGAPSCFISLTYADEAIFGDNPTSDRDWKNHIEILRKRIERKIKSLRAIWRIELKRRKSGKFQSMIAPHYHMLVWGLEPESEVEDGTTFAEWLNQQWYEILDTGLAKHFEHGTFVSKVDSSRHAMSYVSKYVAKEEDDFEDNYEVGRRWGRFGTFDCKQSLEVVMDEETFTHFKRLLRSWLKSKGRDYAKRIARMRSDRGITIYGLGDKSLSSDSLLPDGFLKFLVLHSVELRDLFLSVDT